MAKSASIRLIGRVRAQLAAVGDRLRQRPLALRVVAGAEGRDEAVDDLLVVDQPVLVGFFDALTTARR